MPSDTTWMGSLEIVFKEILKALHILLNRIFCLIGYNLLAMKVTLIRILFCKNLTVKCKILFGHLLGISNICFFFFPKFKQY